MSIIEIRDFIFETYYKQIGFFNKRSYYSMKRLKKILLLANKLMEKVLDPCNAKWHYQSFIRKKSRKSVKQSEITAYQPKPFENPNINYIK